MPRPSADVRRGLPASPRHQVARRLEGSARGALVAVVVPAESIPNAISVVTVVQMAGEVSSSPEPEPEPEPEAEAEPEPEAEAEAEAEPLS